MCGIFGIVSNKCIQINEIKVLVSHARQRGKDSSGLVYMEENGYIIKRRSGPHSLPARRQTGTLLCSFDSVHTGTRSTCFLMLKKHLQ